MCEEGQGWREENMSCFGNCLRSFRKSKGTLRVGLTNVQRIWRSSWTSRVMIIRGPWLKMPLGQVKDGGSYREESLKSENKGPRGK
jgi:hypothetical protein